MTGHRVTWFHPNRPVEGNTIYTRPDKEPPMSLASKLPYNRAERRVADNAHGNQPTGDYNLDESDDVARATYPDPKTRALKIASGETAILNDKYTLAETDRAASGDLADYTRHKTTKS